MSESEFIKAYCEQSRKKEYFESNCEKKKPVSLWAHFLYTLFTVLKHKTNWISEKLFTKKGILFLTVLGLVWLKCINQKISSNYKIFVDCFSLYN